MSEAQKMPETPEELVPFIRSVVNEQMLGLHREVLEEVKKLGERQARIEGRLEGVERLVEAYREDIKGFQVETRAENEKFRQEIRSENEKFRQEIHNENEKFHQEVNARFATIEGRLERMEGRLFDMQRALTTQTRWLLTLLVAAPVIYSLMQKLLGP